MSDVAFQEKEGLIGGSQSGAVEVGSIRSLMFCELLWFTREWFLGQGEEDNHHEGQCGKASP